MTASGATYLLEGKGSDLKQHVNQLVEITGTSDSSASSSSATSTPTETGSARANAQRLQVEAVRMIASSCGK